MDVAVTGASGLIGSAVTAHLRAAGHTVHPMVRGRAEAGAIQWAPEVDSAALDGVDAVVHLAGEPIDQRWTSGAKKRIFESRRDGTRRLATALAGLDRPPRVMVSMSAEGYYGDLGEQRVHEHDGPGRGFLADVCVAWEGAADAARDAGIRVVHPRMVMALGRHARAYVKLRRAFRLGLGGPIGTGQQWWSWIHLDDAAAALAHLIQSDLDGPVNVAAPDAVRQRTFAKDLGRVLHRPAVMPLPAVAVRALFGELGETVLLGGHRLDTTRLAQSGFRWTYPALPDALHAVGSG